MTDTFKLLGEFSICNPEHQALLSFLRTKGISCTVKPFKSSLHIRSVETGFEIEFFQATLNSVFLYLNTPKIKTYRYQLPYSITPQMTLESCVQLLGEPTRKSKHLIECGWENLGIQILFAGQKWESGNQPIDYICIFGPRNSTIDKCAVCLSATQIECFSCQSCDIIKYCSKKCYEDHYFYHQIHCQQID